MLRHFSLLLEKKSRRNVCCETESLHPIKRKRKKEKKGRKGKGKEKTKNNQKKKKKGKEEETRSGRNKDASIGFFLEMILEMGMTPDF